MPPGHLGRERPVSLEAIHVFDVVAPPVLPEQLVAEARWAGAFLAPWIYRRLAGKSSGDGRLAKRPELTPVEA